MAGIASVTFNSSGTGVFGDLVSSDSSFLSAYSVSLAFTDDSSLNAVLPYTPGGAVVPVFNPGTAAANVTVTPYSANGAAGAASTTSVAAGARALIAPQRRLARNGRNCEVINDVRFKRDLLRLQSGPTKDDC